jgi:hypothetical protein
VLEQVPQLFPEALPPEPPEENEKPDISRSVLREPQAGQRTSALASMDLTSSSNRALHDPQQYS